MKKGGARRKRRILLGIATTLVFFAASLLYFLEMMQMPQVVDFDFSELIFDRNGTLCHASLSHTDEWCIPISLDKMGKWTTAVTIGIEDKRFYAHNGVDPLALLRAAFDNLKHRKVVSGASTITSQLMRISNPQPRTWKVKSREFAAALKIETMLSKQEILELYLNRAPFGGNIRGIEAAAQAYFNKHAEHLSLAESVLLISTLKSPSALRPDRYPERAQKIRDRKLRMLEKNGIITALDATLAQEEKVAAGRYPFPQKTRMAAAHIRQAKQGAKIFHASIHSDFQEIVEQSVKQHLREYASEITAAVVVLDNASGEVLAYMGNAREGSGLPAAWVDCGNAPRSPGSTLKPFIYAAAFENGLLTPAMMLADTPLSFAGSAPRNFDLSYRGPVSARFALSHSLNAPAVRVLRMVGYGQTVNMFRLLDFSHIDQAGRYYADALALGGCEITLLQLANAYRTLANGGSFSPLRWQHGAKQEKAIQAISPSAAFLTLDILCDERRMSPLYQELFQSNKQHLAFKTGTSYGLRDAWCAGVSSRYTIVVWMGVPQGSAKDELIGLQSATPLMLRIFKKLLNDNESHFTPPETVFKRKVCALSGKLPSHACPVTLDDWAVRDVSPTALCDLHRLENGSVKTTWPKDLAFWFHAQTRLLPEQMTIHILRPRPGDKILKTSPQEQTAVFFSAEGPAPHYWYLDGQYLATDKSGAGFYKEIPNGKHRATVLSAGNKRTVNFEVLTPAMLPPLPTTQQLH